MPAVAYPALAGPGGVVGQEGQHGGSGSAGAIESPRGGGQEEEKTVFPLGRGIAMIRTSSGTVLIMADLYPDLLSLAVVFACDYHAVLCWFDPQVARSYVVDTKTGVSKLDPIRTSYGAAIM